MTRRYVIFDFDGTIADSFSLTVKAFNTLSGPLGFASLSNEEAVSLRKYSSEEILLEKFHIAQWKLPWVVFRAKRTLEKHYSGVKMFPGIFEVLDQLRQDGFLLGLLTSNSPANTDLFLQKNNLDMFSFVHAGASLFGKDRVVRKLMRQYHFEPTQGILVGDETRDIDAAQKVGLPIIAVTWGFNDIALLAKKSPSYLAHDPKELMKIIERHYANR